MKKVSSRNVAITSLLTSILSTSPMQGDSISAVGAPNRAIPLETELVESLIKKGLIEPKTDIHKFTITDDFINELIKSGHISDTQLASDDTITTGDTY